MHSWTTLNAILMLLPSPLQDARLIGLFVELKKFKMVSKGLQKADSNLYDARYALNFLADKYPSTESKLGPNFTDYLWRPFESAIGKVQSNKEPNLSVEERTSLEAFLVDPLIGEVAQAEVGEVDSYEALVKRARQEIPVIVMTKYINTAFVKPDTNVCERLFSLSRKVWREDRKSMTQAHFELVMFLKCNRELWDERLVYKCRTNPRRKPAPIVPLPLNPLDEAAEEEVVDDPNWLGAFIAELDAENMIDHQNVFVADDNDAELLEMEDNEIADERDGHEEDMEDDDFSDDEFAFI